MRITTTFARGLLFALFMSAGSVHAQIHLAQVIPLAGPIGVEGREFNLGAQVAVNAVNARGGVAGQRVVLRTEDDAYKAENTLAIVREIVKTPALALIMPIGLASVGKLVDEKVLDEAGIPIVGMIPGGALFRDHPYVFHVRASDLDQYKAMVRTAVSMNMKRIGLVNVDIPFGRGGAKTVEDMLKAEGLTPVVKVEVPVKTNSDYTAAIQTLDAAAPNMVMIVAPAQIVGDFVKAFRERGYLTPIMTPSYGNADVVCDVAGARNARGLGVAQVFPNIRNTTIPLVRRFQEDFKAHAPKDRKPSVLHFEGYVNAMVVLEGLKRTNGTPTRQKLVQVLDNADALDLGGFTVSYSKTNRSGSRFVDIGVIGVVGDRCQVLY